MVQPLVGKCPIPDLVEILKRTGLQCGLLYPKKKSQYTKNFWSNAYQPHTTRSLASGSKPTFLIEVLLITLTLLNVDVVVARVTMPPSVPQILQQSLVFDIFRSVPLTDKTVIKTWISTWKRVSRIEEGSSISAVIPNNPEPPDGVSSSPSLYRKLAQDIHVVTRSKAPADSSCAQEIV